MLIANVRGGGKNKASFSNNKLHDALANVEIASLFSRLRFRVVLRLDAHSRVLSPERATVTS